MKLKEILAISGQPGLYRFIAQSNNGMIVEAISDGKRSKFPASARVSSMGEIAIYTEDDDKPLSVILEALYAKADGKPTISHKSKPEKLKALFAEVVPDYDRDMVHISDIKKIVAWYNLLVEAGITDFSIEEEDATNQESDTQATKED